jgi:hypothetical protein
MQKDRRGAACAGEYAADGLPAGIATAPYARNTPQ